MVLQIPIKKLIYSLFLNIINEKNIDEEHLGTLAQKYRLLEYNVWEHIIIYA